MSKKNSTVTVYFVRGGTHQGAYLKIRERKGEWANRLKYSWTNRKDLLCEMTYEQARNAIRQTYGGTLCKRVYHGNGVVDEAVVA